MQITKEFLHISKQTLEFQTRCGHDSLLLDQHCTAYASKSIYISVQRWLMANSGVSTWEQTCSKTKTVENAIAWSPSIVVGIRDQGILWHFVSEASSQSSNPVFCSSSFPNPRAQNERGSTTSKSWEWRESLRSDWGCFHGRLEQPMRSHDELGRAEHLCQTQPNDPENKSSKKKHMRRKHTDVITKSLLGGNEFNTFCSITPPPLLSSFSKAWILGNIVTGSLIPCLSLTMLPAPSKCLQRKGSSSYNYIVICASTRSVFVKADQWSLISGRSQVRALCFWKLGLFFFGC